MIIHHFVDAYKKKDLRMLKKYFVILAIFLFGCSFLFTRTTINSAGSLKIRSISISPDSKYFVTGGDNQSIYFWEIKNNFKKNINLPFWIEKVLYSPDGKHILSISNESITLWDSLTGNKLLESKITSSYFTNIIYSPDSEFIISSTYDNEIIIWDTKTLTKLKSYSLNIWEKRAVLNFAYGKKYPVYVLSIEGSSEKEKIRIFSAMDGLLVKTITGHVDKTRRDDENSEKVILFSDTVSSLALSPDCKTIASGSLDTVKVWDFNTTKLIYEFTDNDGRVYNIKYSNDSRYLMAASGKEIEFWDLKSGKNIKTFYNIFDKIETFEISPDGKTIVSGNFNGSIDVWENKF